MKKETRPPYAMSGRWVQVTEVFSVARRTVQTPTILFKVARHNTRAIAERLLDKNNEENQTLKKVKYERNAVFWIAVPWSG